MGKQGLNKHQRASMKMATLNYNPAVSAMKTTPGLAEKFNAYYEQGLFGNCWRMILSTGLKLEAAGVKK